MPKRAARKASQARQVEMSLNAEPKRRRSAIAFRMEISALTAILREHVRQRCRRRLGVRSGEGVFTPSSRKQRRRLFDRPPNVRASWSVHDPSAIFASSNSKRSIARAARRIRMRWPKLGSPPVWAISSASAALRNRPSRSGHRSDRPTTPRRRARLVRTNPDRYSPLMQQVSCGNNALNMRQLQYNTCVILCMPTLESVAYCCLGFLGRYAIDRCDADPEPLGDVLALCASAGEPDNVSGLRAGCRRAPLVADPRPSCCDGACVACVML